jgi:hypothetical protein
MLTPALRSQVLVSEGDWKLLKDISKNSRDIRTVKSELRDVNEQGEQLARDEESASACSPGSQHSDCGNSGDAQPIEQKKQALLQEWKAGEMQLRALEDRVNEQLARIRTSKVLAGREEWSQQVKRCASLPPVDAVGCLDALRGDHHGSKTDHP